MVIPKRASAVQSFFLQDNAFLDNALEFPSAGSLLEYDKIAFKVYPDSLHHLVWLSLHWKLDSKTKNPPKFQVFEKLQHSSNVLNNGAPESLCQLDIEAFLCATAHTAYNALEHRKSLSHRSVGDNTLSVHPDISLPLSTEDQSLWWRCAYLLYSNSVKEKLGEFRQVLRRGLEVIRGFGNHGLDVNLVVHLSRHFGEQAAVLRKRLGDDLTEEVVAIEDRAVHYWNVALELLDKAMRNQRQPLPKERMFGTQFSEPSTQEVTSLREEGRFFLACYKQNNEMLEEAVEEFTKLNSEYASYNLAQVLKKLTAKTNDKDTEIGLLERTKDALYLTMDRVANNRNHPLNLTLHEEVEAVELQLSENQDSLNAAEILDKVDEDLTSPFVNGSPRRRILLSNGSSTTDIYCTPRQSPLNSNVSRNVSSNLNDSFSGHVRPSPERLDAQLRAMTLTLNKFYQDFTDAQKTILESNKTVLDELKQNKSSFDEIKSQLNKVQKAKCFTCTSKLQQISKSIAEDEEEEEEENAFAENLYDYALEAENDYSYGSYPHSGMVAPHRGGASNIGYNYPQPPMMLHYPPQYPAPHLAQPPMGLDMSQRPRNYMPQHYGAGPGLPFSEGQQLPQFSFRMPPPHQGQVMQPMSPATPSDNRSVYARLGEPTPPGVSGTLVEGPPPFATPCPVVSKPVPAANAFQIPLPPADENASQQPPTILNNSYQDPADQSENGGMLKNLLATTPNTTFFGSPSRGGFQSMVSASTGKESRSPRKDDNSGSESESEYEVTGDFVAHSPILAEVETCTGEENETVLFEERAKLFRYVEKEWKERGVGILKLLLNEGLNRVRLLMRRDQVLKVCANHYIKPNMELKPMKDNEKALIWIAEDFADEEVKPEQFCIRFKTVEITNAFKVEFLKATKMIEKESISEMVEKPAIVPVVGFGDKFKAAAGSWVCDACLVSNGADKVACLACETPKPGAIKPDAIKSIGPIASKPALTPISLSFGGVNLTQTTKTSADTTDMSLSVKSIFGSNTIQTSGFGNLFKVKPKCDACAASSVDKPDCLSCNALQTSSLATPPSQFKFGMPATSSTPTQNASVLGGFTFSTTPVIQSADKPKETVARKVKESQPTEPKAASPFVGFQFKTPPKLNSVDTPFTFGASSKLGTPTFGSLSADSSFKSLSSTKLPSTESMTTHANSSSPNTSKEFSDDFEPSVHFTPVVPLPELVETKTGEEEEEKLFAARAKLFRYDSDTKEWKERGIGELKILRNTSGRCRILMRRDQVLKLCANHSILPEMKLTTFNDNDRAWKWFAQDFAEEVLRNEYFAIKFKTQEIASNFEKAFNEAAASALSAAKSDTVTSSTPCSDLLTPALITEIETNKKTVEKPATTVAFNFSGLSFQKTNEGLWECKECYVRNQPNSLACISCSTAKPSSLESLQTTPFKTLTPIVKSSHSHKNSKPDPELNQPKSSFRFDGLNIEKPKENCWECTTCYVKNEPTKYSCIACDTPKPGSTRSTVPLSIENAFSLANENWECSACYIMNTPSHLRCQACTAPKPPSTQEKDSAVAKFKFGIPDNSKSDDLSTAAKPIFGQKETTFGFAKPFLQQSNFTFGSTAAQESIALETGILRTPPKNPPNTPFGGPIEFQFGSPQKFEFNFSGVRPRSPNKTPKSPGTPNDSVTYGTEDEAESSSDADNIFFQPVIPLPPKVDVKTGEEDEESLYSQRAKLYRFDNGEWKERGTGDIKILWNACNKRVRLLMRREQVLKVCLNHCITKSLEMCSKNEKTWIWASTDFSENEPHPEQFAIRFKNKEIAEQFKKAFDESKDKLDEDSKNKVDQEFNKVEEKFKNKLDGIKTNGQIVETTAAVAPQTPMFSLSSDAAKGFSFKVKPNQQTPTKTGFGLAAHLGMTSLEQGNRSPAISDGKFITSSDISIIEEKTATSQQKEQAKELQLPSNFYLYEKKEPCKGCRGCESCDNDKECEVIFELNPTQDQLDRAAALQLPPSFYLYENKPPCPGCRGCEDDFSPVNSIPSPKPVKTTPITEPKPIFKLPKLPETSTTLFKSNLTQDGTPKPIFGSAGTMASFSFSNISSPKTLKESALDIKDPVSDEATQPTENASVFGAIGTIDGFSFASLASKTDVAATSEEFGAFKTSNLHVFAGAGTPLFGAKTALNTSGGDDEVAPSVDIHFEPVVPLPELIEVKTGEEDETAVFNERAKLYRFDKTVSQWKERGVGQFKILKHKVKCQYRLILRREQVHKVACNHYLTPTVELSPMNNNDNSLCWTAMDFTEGSLMTELFAIRFKNKDLLNLFKQTFNECRDMVCKNAIAEAENAELEAVAQSIIVEEPECVITEYDETENVESGEVEQKDDKREEEEEAEDEDDDDDSEIMFEKRVTLAVLEGNSQEYKVVGLGSLQIRYDDSIFAAQIQMSSDQEELLCNHHIAIQTCLRVQGQDAFWTAMDISVDPPARRQFKAKFSSLNALEDFQKAFEEGKKLAIESGIVENNDPHI